VQPQNTGQLQRTNNSGGPQNTGGLHQRNLNIGIQSLRSRNTLNIFADNLIYVQRYNDLIGDTNPFSRTQDTENLSSQSAKFSTLLISGYSFP
ncbi:14157_t:CDS:1, partial [Gigaspora margarita]